MMMKMRVKICGITRLSDLEAAVRYGADALGFVVGTTSSPRNLTISRAKKLMKQISVFNTKVAVTSSTDRTFYGRSLTFYGLMHYSYIIIIEQS